MSAIALNAPQVLSCSPLTKPAHMLLLLLLLLLGVMSYSDWPVQHLQMPSWALRVLLAANTALSTYMN